jgi:hypothetical protein
LQKPFTHPLLLACALLALGAVSAPVACGGGSQSEFVATDASDSGDDAIASDDSSLFNETSVDAQEADAPPPETIVYAHSASTLYRLDPNTKQVTTVGPFSGGCTQVADVAIDADANAYVTTFTALYELDLKTAGCTHIADGSYPNSLSFVPKGTLDPNVEVLVGYFGSTYVRIDTGSGAITNVGTLTGGYASAGDIVSVINGGTFLTVTGTTCGGQNCLLQVDPTTGDIVQNYGSVNHKDVWGLSFWAGALYGFDDAGELFEITASNNAIQTADLPVSPGLSFWGAGSSTKAPVTDADGGTIPIR